MQALVRKYFPDLKPRQYQQFEQLEEIILDWNSKINVISRKDTEAFEINHLLHALAINKYQHFKVGSKVLDIGTGGGFPGVPLAILNPKCSFHLVDSIGKKIKVVQDAVEKLGLEIVKTEQNRVENLKGEYRYIVSRAVAPTKQLITWTKKLQNPQHCTYLFLKGGDLTEELKEIGFRATVINISQYYKEPFFETKKIVVVKA